ncbi:alkaline shock response membrane anchor protein AmaP [Streptococcus pacificus]|uniref:Alkaline shock response membrane anchor protein AmaP n=1 Tax=Streptococcus pacificus TaxID=2740577 RepID=A0ABS0ZIT3_9STRE|nr:alkaline shock response membrane anchor protein AmaP [Streptococcus pacificus]MBJ8325753.1 alkaline shock response membrane anchor protein AmaP [Streptococcus pacificus]
MSKLTKIISFIIGILVLTFLGAVVFINAHSVVLPDYMKWLQYKIELPSYLTMFNDGFLSQYLFWVSLVLFVVIIIAILVVLFYPRTKTEIDLKEKQGTLLLSKSAIEGYVRSLIHNKEIMETPNVSVKLYKRKFKVVVSGTLESRVNVVPEVSQIKTDIEKGLREFFGLNQSVKFNISVKKIKAPQKELAAPRVV